MHPDRGIVRMHIRSDVIYTRSYDNNTINRQYTATNDPPREPFTAPIHGILPGNGPTLFCGYVYVYIYSPGISAVIIVTTNTAPLRQETAHSCIRYPVLSPLLSNVVP